MDAVETVSEIAAFVIDYQQVVDIAVRCITVALPIGIIFGIAGKAVNFFLSMVFGKERVDL